MSGCPTTWGTVTPVRRADQDGRPDGSFDQDNRRSSLLSPAEPWGSRHVITVLIADDHPLVRGVLVDVLTGTDDMSVVAECADGSEVAEAAARTSPDVVLMDLQMPRMSGLDAIRALAAADARARVVVLTGSLTPASAQEARALGVAGFLLKGDDPAE